jgi:hypothetical protein
MVAVVVISLSLSFLWRASLSATERLSAVARFAVLVLGARRSVLISGDTRAVLMMRVILS